MGYVSKGNTKAKQDMLFQHAKHRQTIQACRAKLTVYKGLQKPKTADRQKQQNSCGNQKSPSQGIGR